MDPDRCRACGLCELGCDRGAKWDARRLLTEVASRGGDVRSGARVVRVLVERDRACGVVVQGGSAAIRADAVLLAAGGIGTAQILRASGLPTSDRLWIDVVLTLGGTSRGAR